MMTFQTFSVEFNYGCTYDALRVYDGPDEASPELAELCGHMLVSKLNSVDTCWSVTNYGHVLFSTLNSVDMSCSVNLTLWTCPVQ